MDVKEKLLDSIEERLTVYANWINQGGGIRSDASEDLYRELLNTAWEYELENMNWVKDNFPAIDLGDGEERLAVQVTSTGDAAKVRKTLDRFYAHKLEKDYDRLIVLIAGKAECKSSKFDHPGLELEIWGTVELKEALRKLSVKKLREVEAFLLERVDAPRVKEPVLHLPLKTSLGLEGFVGREKELADMAEALNRGVKPLVVWGLGGMGKTELVNHFGRRYTGGKVYLALFRGNFRDTVTQSIARGMPELEKLRETERYAPAMARLRQCSENDILIIDNADLTEGSFADFAKEETYRELCALPMHIIITTRMQVRDGIGLTRLENAQLYQIFRRHGVALSEQEMDGLITAVNGHTMTVDLIARTLDESWEEVTPAMILEAMAASTLPEEDYPEICSDHNRDPEQRKIYTHLRTLFNLTGISEAGRYVLRCATLLPAGGMFSKVFRSALQQDARAEVKLLNKRGWVSRENHLLTIHPVVRLVCRTELKPTDENCEAFLEGVKGQYDRKQYNAVTFRQMADMFENAADILADETGMWAAEAGYFWSMVAEHRRALSCRMRAVEKREKKQPGTNELAKAYNNVGSTYGTLGEHKRALEYKLKALRLREKVLQKDHPSIAASYNNVGTSYGELGNYKKALEFKLIALEIRERILEKDNPDLAASYNNVGISYGALGNHEKSLEYKLTALRIRKEALGENHPDVAASYNNVGYTYGQLGNHTARLEYYLKALTIREKVLPGNHPDRAMSCHNVAWTYHNLGQIDQAAVYMRRAADVINRSALPEQHRKRVKYNKWADRFEREAQQAQDGD